jgi:hypothetical protein
LVNPVLGGVLGARGSRPGPAAASLGTASVAVLLLAVSPWLIFMSAEFMPHPLTGVLVLLAALACDHASERGPRWAGWAALAGVAAGALALTRAIDAAILLAALAATLTIDRRLVRALPAAVLAGVVQPASALSSVQSAVTGRPPVAAHGGATTISPAWIDLGLGRTSAFDSGRILTTAGQPADVVPQQERLHTNVDLFGAVAR